MNRKQNTSTVNMKIEKRFHLYSTESIWQKLSKVGLVSRVSCFHSSKLALHYKTEAEIF